MPRTDIHTDAMLRHLGAAYYESLHGRATRADVARALDTVEEHLNEPRTGGPRSDGHPDRGHRVGREADGVRRPHGWSRRVSDVMTPTVVTVDRITPYKEVARLMAEHRISGLPVLKMGREVAGVVTEADLLREQASAARRLRTSPAIVIGPDATVPAAARLMTAHHVQRLPVINEDGKLVGIVSRRDLISVFLRPDADIAADIRRVLDDIVLAGPGEADVAVRNGIVTLTGTLEPKAGAHGDLIPVALRLMWNVDGVVDVVDRLGEVQAAPPAPAVPPDAVPRQANSLPENRPADAG
jgi:CBS domain-containing protein